VKRAVDANDPGQQISGILQVTTFTDVSAFPGNAYIYRVYAIDKVGNLSDPSEKSLTVQ
jgi:hypothetical protein